MCPRFVFLLITRVASWLRLSQRKEAWQTAEILIEHSRAVGRLISEYGTIALSDLVITGQERPVWLVVVGRAAAMVVGLVCANVPRVDAP